MIQESHDELERLLAAAPLPGAPAELRSGVLSSVERELRAARWDHRLARVAVLLLVVGIGMNASLVLKESRTQGSPSGRIAQDRQENSLIKTAIVVTEATDVETGRRFVRQIAAMSGRELTDRELEAIDAAIERDRG
jgi:hypothetical protein